MPSFLRSLLRGRPSIPIEAYLRLTFLKFAYHLSYEVLCREVADLLSWRRLCRIPLGEHVPHWTTLIRITGRCTETIDEFNEILLAKAVGKKVVRVDKVVSTKWCRQSACRQSACRQSACRHHSGGANVVYPTDSGQLAKSIGKIKLIGRIHAAGGARRTKVRNRTQTARAIASKLQSRGDETKNAVKAITGELADLAMMTADDAEAVICNARRHLRGAGADSSKSLAGLVRNLETTIKRTRGIVELSRTTAGTAIVTDNESSDGRCEAIGST